MNISVRTYSNWKNNKHKNIILILNSIFKENSDLLLWTKYKIIPQYKYFNKQDELTNEHFRKELCKLLGINVSNYYYWKNGKRSNIMNLFIQVFKNPDNINYWLENKKFELTTNDNEIKSYISYINKINDNEYCKDNFSHINSSFFFESININDFKNHLIISINCNTMNSKEKIKYELINSIQLSNNLDSNLVIKEYKNFISTIEKLDSNKLKKLFHKSTIYSMFIYSIKNIDLNLFIKLFLLITTELGLDNYLKYLDFFLKYERNKLYSKIQYSNNNLNSKDIQINILTIFFVKIISSIKTLNLNDSFCQADRSNLLLNEIHVYYKIKELGFK